jgi:elongation factor 1-beta
LNAEKLHNLRRADEGILGVSISLRPERENHPLLKLPPDFVALDLPLDRQAGSVVALVLFMGQVAVVIKIMPEDMGKFEELKKDALTLKPYKMEEQPVAFGIVALSLTFVVEDGAGGADLLEERAGKLPNVSNVEVVSMDRL